MLNCSSSSRRSDDRSAVQLAVVSTSIFDVITTWLEPRSLTLTTFKHRLRPTLPYLFSAVNNAIIGKYNICQLYLLLGTLSPNQYSIFLRLLFLSYNPKWNRDTHMGYTPWEVGLHESLCVTCFRVGQIKRGHLSFLLVTIERIYKIKSFSACVNYIRQQAARCQFYLNESVTR